MSAKSYTAADIEVLEGLEPVRKRPGMFIAGTDTPAGLHQLAFEILDNSVDEAMNGHADKIELTLHHDQSSVTVADNGRGIPVEKHPKHKKPTLELIFTTLHAGGKFSDKNYETAGGLHGVGSSVVNALSEELIVSVRRDGKEYEQRFSRGAPKGSLKVCKQSGKGTTGTTVFFRPDPQIFAQTRFSAELLRSTLQTKAYLNPGLRVKFVNEKAGSSEEFYYSDGLAAYLRQLLEEKKAKIIGGEIFFVERKDVLEVSLALVWTESTREQFSSYANGIYTADGGSHEVAAKTGLVKAVRNYITVHGLEPKGVKIVAEDIREGMVCLVAVKIPGNKFQVQFQGQTKSKLNNPEIQPHVEAVAKLLEQQLNEKPTVAQTIVNRIILAAKAREASRMAVQNVTRKLGISHRLTLPGKLADCSSIRPHETELFIVEGDSAGGSAKQGRDRHFQAVLPLRGKVLNTIVSSTKEVAENKELSNIISALGCGAAESFRGDKLRYGKVIILTDADADGMHIATLLLAFFFVHLRGLIQTGNLFLGKPPLYGVFPKRGLERVVKMHTTAKGEQQDWIQGQPETATEENNTTEEETKGRKTSGKKEKGGRDKGNKSGKGEKEGKGSAFWAFSDDELQEVLAQHKLHTPRIVRYKGLGEMNPETLWSTTLDPKHRTLLRVTLDDEELVFQALKDLMGSDPSKRLALIQAHAATLEIDV